MSINRTVTPSSGGPDLDGVFMNEMQIASITHADKTPYSDIALIIQANVIGKPEWGERSFFVNGSFEKDPQTGIIEAWKFPKHINNFFDRIDVPLTVSDNGQLSASTSFPEAEGKHFYSLSYASNKRQKNNPEKDQIRTWHGEIASLDEGKQSLFDRFRMQNRKGYPKDYKHLDKYLNVSSSPERNSDLGYTPPSNISI